MVAVGESHPCIVLIGIHIRLKMLSSIHHQHCSSFPSWLPCMT
jgi:hypothetical protein